MKTKTDNKKLSPSDYVKKSIRITNRSDIKEVTLTKNKYNQLVRDADFYKRCHDNSEIRIKYLEETVIFWKEQADFYGKLYNERLTKEVNELKKPNFEGKEIRLPRSLAVTQ